MSRSSLPLACLTLLAFTFPALRAADRVNQSARDLPIAYDVDVVVVGGSTGAVSAAVTAAEQGARVFLAAPHPYLGDDMTATLKLWLEKGEIPTSPLAQRLFSDNIQAGADPNRLEFRYEVDVPTNSKHPEKSPPSRLIDGHWSDASSQSVQYDASATIVADLGKSQDVREVRLMAFGRREETTGGGGFAVKSMDVQVSQDGQQWSDIGSVTNERPFDDHSVMTVPVNQPAHYVRLVAKKDDSVGRILLGEVEIIGPKKETEVPAEVSQTPPRPMHVKKTLDDALLEAGVQYLYSCFPTDVLRDADGQICGIVMANRAGRQAVVAKTIIDATPRATVARFAGAEFRPYQPGVHTFQRVVIGGEPKELDRGSVRDAAKPFQGPYPNRAKTSSGEFRVLEYTLPLQVEDDSYAAYMEADQRARTLTYDPEQQYTSDVLFELPPDPMFAEVSVTATGGELADLPLDAFCPKQIDRLWVLGGCADIPREQAAKLLRPLALMNLGVRLGKVAATQAADLAKPAGITLAGQPADSPTAAGDVKEFLDGARPVATSKTIPQQPSSLPVFGKYDVVVIGGGTGGAPAGIGAARQGAKTLVVEYQYGLGGVGTLGAISNYYWGNRIGFTSTVLDGKTSWVIEQKMEWYRDELLKAGADIWFGCIGCGAFVEGNKITGAVVVTPEGRGVVLADVVIDATGNSDVAAAAGAPTIYTDASEFGMQGTGLPGRNLGETYNNTDFTIVDETDMVDVWHVYVYSKGKYPKAFDHGKLIDTRERRRIVGDFTITLPDQINERTHPDTVVHAYSNFDTHGYTVDPYLLLEHPEKVGVNVYIPYRAMLPKGMEGVLVIGLGISAHRDAIPLIRMQPDIQNGGYAAGVAASMAAAYDTPLREIDLPQLQRHLIEIGNLPESVLTAKDSYPLPDERIAQAVKTIKDEGRGAAVIAAHPDRALPMLKQAYQSATGEDKQAYAQALAVLGDATGLETLLEQLGELKEWDAGWNYRGMGQFGAALSPMDNLIVALGRTGKPEVLPAIIEKMKLLDASLAFSHHRAVALALELIGDPSAAPALAELLSKPDMTGHVHDDIETATIEEVPGGTNAETTRRESLRELLLARALYRCGDLDGIGEKILREYTKDYRGHLARHAQAILQD